MHEREWVCTTECYSAIKKKRHQATKKSQRNLKCTWLSEGIQSGKSASCMISVFVILKNTKVKRQKKDHGCKGFVGGWRDE
jgi:hypothetical protein